jgi:hypothetical protein
MYLVKWSTKIIKPSTYKIGDVYTSKNIISRGLWEVKVETENGSLWLLLQWHALQTKSLDTEDEFKLLKIVVKTETTRWPNKKCQFMGAILRLEKAWGVTTHDHSYTPSLVLPFTRISPNNKSFTKKHQGKNSTDTLLSMQNWYIESKLRLISGTHNIFWSLKEWADDWRVEEPKCVIHRLLPSPIITSSVPV